MSRRPTGSTACSTNGWRIASSLPDRYSIADMAIYPWMVPYERQGQKLEDFPHLKRWFEAMRDRPAVKRAYALAKEINTAPTVSEELKKVLFGQTAAVLGAMTGAMAA